MKNIVFKTKFDDCKTLREVLDKINNTFFEKASYYLLNLWILYPLLMMGITYFFDSNISFNIMFYLLILIGISGLFLGLIYSFKKFYKRTKFSIKKYLPIVLFIVLLCWCTFTSFFSKNYNLSFIGEMYRREGLQTYFLYFGVFILGIILKNKNLLLKLFNKLLLVEVVVAIISVMDNSITYSLMNCVGANSLSNVQKPYMGIFLNSNHYGYYLMFGVLLSIFMFIKDNKKILYLIGYSILLYMLIINDTLGCFLAIFLTLILIIIYYLFIKKKIKILIPIIMIFILTSIFAYRDGQNVVYKNIKGLLADFKIINEVVKETKNTNKNDKINSIGTNRGRLWKYGISYIGESPIIGHGIESTHYLYKQDNINQSRPHNILIQFGIFTGIPGIILYITFILSILIRNLKKIKILDNISIFSLFIVICYLISSMFGNSMFYTSPYFFIFLGITCKNAFYKKELS